MTHRWRFSWAWTIGVVLVLSACRPSGPPPGPPEPPPSTCPDLGLPWCHEAGMSCGECQHQPPGAECPIQAAPCDVSPTPQPPPATGCVLAGDPGAELTGYVSPPLPGGRYLGERVNDAIGALTGCSAPGRCIIIARPQTYQAAVEEQLRAWGFCAGQHGPETDEIAVQHPATRAWESFHIYAGDGWHDPSATGTVVWYFKLSGPVTGPPYSGSARPVFAAPEDSPLPPPTSGACGSPLPPKTWTAETLPDGWGQDEIGRPRWIIGCNRHGRVVDCTPQVFPRACGYCDAIGMGTYADGQLRCGCPVRPEGHPERGACEAYLLGGGTRLESKDGAPCERASANPLQFVPRDGQCRLCSADGSVCGDWH